MSRFAIVTGLLLCGLTFVGLVWSMQKMPTQFYPMMLGIPILFCGVVGLNPHRRRYSMYVAAALALIGTLAGGSGTIMAAFRMFRGVEVNRIAFDIVLMMTTVCLIFAFSSLASLILEHRRRTPMKMVSGT